MFRVLSRRTTGTALVLAVGLAGCLAGCGGERAERRQGRPPPPSPYTQTAPRPTGEKAAGCTADLDAIAVRVAEARSGTVGEAPEGVTLVEVPTANPPGGAGVNLTVRDREIQLHQWKYGPKDLAELGRTLETERRLGREMEGEGGAPPDHVALWVDRAVPVSQLEPLLAVIPETLEPRVVVRVTGAPPAGPSAPGWVSEAVDQARREPPREQAEKLLAAFHRAAGSCPPFSESIQAAMERPLSERVPFVLRVVGSDLAECGCSGAELPALEALMLAAEGASGPRTGFVPVRLRADGRDVSLAADATVDDLVQALASSSPPGGPVHLVTKK